MSKTAWIVIIIVVLILAFSVVVYAKTGKDKLDEDISDEAKEERIIFPLGVGSKGEEVKDWQTAINNKHLYPPLMPLVVDGIFGPLTKEATIDWIGKSIVTKLDFDLGVYSQMQPA